MTLLRDPNRHALDCGVARVLLPVLCVRWTTAGLIRVRFEWADSFNRVQSLLEEGMVVVIALMEEAV
jgi:hypothetical protein